MAEIRAIIVNFRTPQDSIRCCDALLASNGVDVAVSIVDNSAEHSARVLLDYARQFEQVEVKEMEGNIGFAAANNTVLNHLDVYREAFFAIVNPDSLIEAQALKTLQDAMREYQAHMAGGLVLNEDGSIQTTCYRNIPNLRRSAIHSLHLDKFFPSLSHLSLNTHLEQIPEEISIAPAISGAFMLISREGIKKVGAFDERYFMHVEDLDLCQRFHDADEKILFVPQARLIHKKGEASAARPIRVQWYLHNSVWRFYRKFQSASDNVLVRVLVFLLVVARFIVMALISALRIAR